MTLLLYHAVPSAILSCSWTAFHNCAYPYQYWVKSYYMLLVSLEIAIIFLNYHKMAGMYKVRHILQNLHVFWEVSILCTKLISPTCPLPYMYQTAPHLYSTITKLLPTPSPQAAAFVGDWKIHKSVADDQLGNFNTMIQNKFVHFI